MVGSSVKGVIIIHLQTCGKVVLRRALLCTFAKKERSLLWTLFMMLYFCQLKNLP